jgi:hypothetical protein
MTRKIGLRELRQNASEIVREVETGETFDVTVSGRLAARLVPAQRSRSHRFEEIADLWDGAADPTFFEDLDGVADPPGGEPADRPTMNAVIDTSVIVSGHPPLIGGDDLFVTAATFAELHAAVLGASSDTDRATRLRQLTMLAALYDPLPLDAGVATAYGRITALVGHDQGSHRPVTMDLLNAATALSNGCRLYTRKLSQFEGLEGVLEVVEV